MWYLQSVQLLVQGTSVVNIILLALGYRWCRNEGQCFSLLKPNCLAHSRRLLLLLTHCALVAFASKWATVTFYRAFWISTEVVYLRRCLVVTWLVSRETAAVWPHFVYTMQPWTMSRHFMQSHIRRLYACLAVTCYLHFWQNDRDLSLCATAVTRRWNGYWSKSQHRKLTLAGEEYSPAAPSGGGK